MADEHQQFQISLEEIFLASRKLRFLHLKSQGEVLFRTGLCGEYFPLFLGADVLSKCSISVPNLPRTHAKFAKKGLATKVNFPSFLRINGIQGTGKGVWFYSIQGLFRVAFEMYSREEQLDLLKCLQGVWTSRFGDQLLDEVTNPMRFDVCEDKEETGRATEDKGKPDKQITTASNDSQYCANQIRNITCLGVMNSDVVEQDPESDTEKVQKDHLSHENFREILPELTDLRRAGDSINSRSEFGVIFTILRTLLQSYNAVNNSSDISFPDYQQRFLYVTCNWVGNEFRKYKTEISQKVTEFKKRHISTIDSLPPAETVISELFPKSMIVLLKTWMEVDTQKTQGHSESQSLSFPLIQLILEFTNQTLVSGVAHVLYSRLIRTDSV